MKLQKAIIFNTEMVQAILNSNKTQTRRLLKKPFEVHPNGYITKPCGDERLVPYDPPYKVGDIMYVRETWAIQSMSNMHKRVKFYFKAGSNKEFKIVYVSAERYKHLMRYECKNGWQPSIFMPKEAARLFLKVTNVRVQRIKDITENEAKSEGIKPYAKALCMDENIGYKRGFNYLCNKLYLLKGHGWDNNPWVWVIEFERIEKCQL